MKLAYPFQNLQYTGLHFSFLGEVIYFTKPTTEFFPSLSQYITFVPKLIFKRKPTAEKLKKPVGLTIIPIFPADTIVSLLVSILPLTKHMPVRPITITSDSEEIREANELLKSSKWYTSEGRSLKMLIIKYED